MFLRRYSQDCSSPFLTTLICGHCRPYDCGAPSPAPHKTIRRPAVTRDERKAKQEKEPNEREKGEKMINTQHVSVMRDECIELLSPAISSHAHPVVIDATLGLGGHTESLLNKFPRVVVIGIDRDKQAIEIASQRLSQFGERFISHHSVFDQIANIAKQHGHSPQTLSTCSIRNSPIGSTLN